MQQWAIMYGHLFQWARQTQWAVSRLDLTYVGYSPLCLFHVTVRLQGSLEMIWWSGNETTLRSRNETTWGLGMRLHCHLGMRPHWDPLGLRLHRDLGLRLHWCLGLTLHCGLGLGLAKDRTIAGRCILLMEAYSAQLDQGLELLWPDKRFCPYIKWQWFMVTSFGLILCGSPMTTSSTKTSSLVFITTKWQIHW